MVIPLKSKEACQNGTKYHPFPVSTQGKTEFSSNKETGRKGTEFPSTKRQMRGTEFPSIKKTDKGGTQFPPTKKQTRGELSSPLQ